MSPEQGAGTIERTAERAQARGQRPALAGLRVAEFGGFAAGPVVGKQLAEYGAEVVRVESRKRLDGFRTHYPPYKDNVPGIERSGIFNFFNDQKRSITLNLKSESAVQVARRLCAWADVVVENFTPGTMARLGLGYDVLAAENPRLVMLSTCNQGQFGPHAGHPGFGTHLTSLSGFTHLLGEPDREPVLLYGPYIDFIAVGYGTAAVLAALARRNRTGQGTYIDLSQYESGLQFMAPALLDLSANGRVAMRRGNRDAVAVPHGVFPCRGDDRWCALSVADDEEWPRFLRALGSPEWGQDPALATAAGRRAAEDRLEQLIAEWTRQLDREEVARRLREQGLRAYPVNSMADLFEDPQLQARGIWHTVVHPVLGRVRVAAPPFLLRDMPPRITHAAPMLGEHTDEVLREMLGYSEQEVQELKESGALE